MNHISHYLTKYPSPQTKPLSVLCRELKQQIADPLPRTQRDDTNYAASKRDDDLMARFIVKFNKPII